MNSVPENKTHFFNYLYYYNYLCVIIYYKYIVAYMIVLDCIYFIQHSISLAEHLVENYTIYLSFGNILNIIININQHRNINATI